MCGSTTLPDVRLGTSALRRPLVPSGYLSGLRAISVPEKPAGVVQQLCQSSDWGSALRRPLVPSGYLSGLRVISVPENLAGVVQQRCQSSDWGQSPYVGHLSQVAISAECVSLAFLKNGGGFGSTTLPVERLGTIALRRPLVPSGYLSGLRVISVPEKPAGMIQQRCQSSDWGQSHYVPPYISLYTVQGTAVRCLARCDPTSPAGRNRRDW